MSAAELELSQKKEVTSKVMIATFDGMGGGYEVQEARLTNQHEGLGTTAVGLLVFSDENGDVRWNERKTSHQPVELVP